MFKNKRKQFKKFYDKGDLEKAYHILKENMENCPDDGWIYALRAELEIKVMNNFSRADHFLNEAYNYDCPKDIYHQVNGTYYWMKGEAEKALEQYEKSYLITPSLVNSVNYAMALSHVNDSRAINLWKDILQKDPKNILANVYIANDLGVRGNISKALEILKKTKNFKPASANELVAIGSAYYLIKQYQEALPYYLKAENYGYKDKANLNVKIADCYLGLEDGLKAIQYVRKAIELEPGNDFCREILNDCKEYFLSLCLSERKYCEAHSMVINALDIWPNDSKLLAYIAILEADFKNNYELAKRYIKEAFKYSNCDLDLLFEIKGAIWFDCLNEKEEGLACLEKAVSLNRNNFNLNALAARIIDVDVEKAEKLSEEVLQSEPQNACAVCILAKVAYKKEDWQKSHELAQKAYDLDSSDPFIIAVFAYANFKVGKLNEALSLYLKAGERGYNDKAYICASIGECHYKLGDLQKAREHANKAININPNDLDAIKLLEQLNANEQ
jgi:tetratricopeptide (TPR) repeat protein